MFLRIALFTLIAIGVTAFGGIAWISLHGPAAMAAAPIAEPPPARTVVLAAAHALRAGSLLKPEDVVAQEVAAAEVRPGARPDTPQARGELLGAMVRRSLVAGEVIWPGDNVDLILTMDDTTMAPGHRVMRVFQGNADGKEFHF